MKALTYARAPLFASTVLALLACEAKAPDTAAAQAGDLVAALDGGGDAQTNPGTFVDARDHQTYPTLAFGGKTWLARNLNVALAEGSFRYGDRAENGETYGRLYTFDAARTACATGWHLPTDDDWKSLEVAVGMASNELDREGYATPRGTDEGSTLKSTSGFGAKMAGFRSGAAYEALGDRTYFWTATTRGTEVWRRRIAAAETTIFRFTNPPEGFAISVRCVMD